MQNFRIKLIHCNGRFTKKNGHVPCKTKFEHLGHWGDKELIAHELEEKKLDNKHDWYIGFEEDKKFLALQDKYDEVSKEKVD